MFFDGEVQDVKWYTIDDMYFGNNIRKMRVSCLILAIVNNPVYNPRDLDYYYK